MLDWLRLVFEDWTGIAENAEAGDEGCRVGRRVGRRVGCVEASTVRDVVDADCGCDGVYVAAVGVVVCCLQTHGAGLLDIRCLDEGGNS